MENSIVLNTLKKLTFAIILLTFFACRKYSDYPTPGQPNDNKGWTRVLALPNQKISVLKIIDNKIYAAAASGTIYRSVDNGKTWNTLSKLPNNTHISTLTKYKNKIVVGTESDGVFMSPDDGNTWVNTFPFPVVARVTSFMIWDDWLYCSSADIDGIFFFDETTAKWTMFRNIGMPVNYNLTVEKTIVFNNLLLAIKGSNANFYTYNLASAKWDEHFFFSTYVPGLKFTDLLVNNNIIYASNGRAILGSDNGGTTWIQDTVGLKKANDIIAPTRIMHSDEAGADFYTLLNIGSNETWVQHRPVMASPGTTWTNNQEHLSIGHAYDICQLGKKVFLATATGLYYKEQ